MWDRFNQYKITLLWCWHCWGMFSGLLMFWKLSSIYSVYAARWIQHPHNTVWQLHNCTLYFSLFFSSLPFKYTFVCTNNFFNLLRRFVGIYVLPQPNRLHFLSCRLHCRKWWTLWGFSASILFGWYGLLHVCIILSYNLHNSSTKSNLVERVLPNLVHCIFSCIRNAYYIFCSLFSQGLRVYAGNTSRVSFTSTFIV